MEKAQNVVYRFRNISKKQGASKYIGSKQGCIVTVIDGIRQMVDCKTGKIYYGSSSNQEYWEDRRRGDIFDLDILEYVHNRNDLVSIEDSYIKKEDAVKSGDYYNLADAKLKCHAQEQIINKFGERLKDVARSASSMAKRDNNARRCGFLNFGDMCFFIHRQLKSGTPPIEVAQALGVDRHYPARWIKDFDMDKAEVDLGKVRKEDVRKLYIEGASLSKICELLNIERPAARSLLEPLDGDYNKSYIAALRFGMTKEELELVVVKKILEGMTYKQVADELGMTPKSCERYFMRYVRKHLKVE